MFISDATIASLRQLHTSAMMDEAELLKYWPGGTDEYNMSEPEQYIYLATLPCSFRPSTGSSSSASSEAMPKSDVPLLDGLISFDFNIEDTEGIDLSSFDRVKIVKLHGETLPTPLLFDLAGPARRDNFANIFPLRRVTEE